jgi:hypothetical protein
MDNRKSVEFIEDVADRHGQAVTMTRPISKDRTVQGFILIMAAIHPQNGNRLQAWEGESDLFASPAWFQKVHSSL